ncbi:MAG: molybdopterin-dependent oxidoreductase [Pseudomonadota bacterium]
MQEQQTIKPGVSRRIFLKLLGVLGLLFWFAGAARAFFTEEFPVRTVEKGDFGFDPATGTILWESGKKEPYRLVVDGLVEEPLSLSYGDLRKLPQVEQVSDFHCVEGWSVKDVHWGGFRLEEIIKRVKLKPEAKFAVFHCLGQTGHQPGGQKYYLESFPLEKILRPEAEFLLVLDQDGKPLSLDHGAPLRVISPYDLAYKSAKYVNRIELAGKARPGWWTLANPIYPVVAPVPQHRLRDK